MVNCFMARSQTNLQFEGSENVHYPTKVELTSGVKSRSRNAHHARAPVNWAMDDARLAAVRAVAWVGASVAED
jgi:hypothetical protein